MDGTIFLKPKEQAVASNIPAATAMQPTAEKPVKSHLSILDSLRGIAALSVCLFHFTSLNGAVPSFVHPLLQRVGGRGYLGVDIFFVISGFIIPYALQRSKYTYASIGNFLTKRVLRILPPAYVTIVVFILLNYFTNKYYLHNPGTTLLTELSWGRAINNLLLTIPFTDYTWFNGIFWTLSIEFEFYFFIALVYPFICRNKWVMLLTFLALTATFYLPNIPEQTLFHHNATFIIGMLTWLVFDKHLTKQYFWLGLVLFSFIGWREVTGPPILAAVATALCILYVKFSHPVTVFLGRISYSLYLLHVAIGFSVNLLLAKVLPTHTLPIICLALAVCLASALIGSYLFCRYVELPFAKLASGYGKEPAIGSRNNRQGI